MFRTWAELGAFGVSGRGHPARTEAPTMRPRIPKVEQNSPPSPRGGLMTPKPAIEMPSLSGPYPSRRGNVDTLLAPRRDEHGQRPCMPGPIPNRMGHAPMHIDPAAHPKTDRPRAEAHAIPPPSAAEVLKGRGRRAIFAGAVSGKNRASTDPALASSRVLMPTGKSHPTPPSQACDRRDFGLEAFSPGRRAPLPRRGARRRGTPPRKREDRAASSRRRIHCAGRARR